MPTRRKSAAAIRSQQTRFLIFFGAIVALVVLTVVTILPAVGPAEDLPLCVEDQDPAQFQELQQLRPEGDGWSEGLASAYSLETNDGWDETASGIPLNNYSPTVAVPQKTKIFWGVALRFSMRAKRWKRRLPIRGLWRLWAVRLT